jgi:hypothetical protein
MKYRYSCTLSLTSATDDGGWVGGQRQAPIALPPGMNRHPLYRSLVEPETPVWTSAEILPPPPLPEFVPRTVQPIATALSRATSEYKVF